MTLTAVVRVVNNTSTERRRELNCRCCAEDPYHAYIVQWSLQGRLCCAVSCREAGKHFKIKNAQEKIGSSTTVCFVLLLLLFCCIEGRLVDNINSYHCCRSQAVFLLWQRILQRLEKLR